MTGPDTGREESEPIQARTLIREVYPLLIQQRHIDIASVACANIYLKMPVESVKRKREWVTKMKYTPIVAVVDKRVKADDQHADSPRLVDPIVPVDEQEQVETYQSKYLLISKHHDAPKEVLVARLKRWNIEILFRMVKQELRILNCHSPNAYHIHAHPTSLFTAETLIRYLQWEHLKTVGREDCTQDQAILNLLCICCQTHQEGRKNKFPPISLDLDIEAKSLARVIENSGRET